MEQGGMTWRALLRGEVGGDGMKRGGMTGRALKEHRITVAMGISVQGMTSGTS